MIVVTGAAGFIGSCLVSQLNCEGLSDLLLVDDFSDMRKDKNLKNKRFSKKIHRDEFPKWLRENLQLVSFVFHLGARTDTAEFDRTILNRLNLYYSKEVWDICVEGNLPLVYASSAATYGMGEWGYRDDHETIYKLKPLNPYGESKNDFDQWVLQQTRQPTFWVGLKLFNVYGPNEYHKGRMASVILHAYNQIKENGITKLFRSHHPLYRDGEQSRDFVYVKDVVGTCLFFMEHRKASGIYNLGSSQPRTFLDLSKNIFNAVNKSPQIEWVDTPLDIRDQYQYFTEANISKLRAVGYKKSFCTLEEGVKEYVQDYLIEKKYF